MESVQEAFKRQFKRLAEKYRGLKKEDLDELNPAYSCVVCKKYRKCGTVGCACPKAEKATEEEFAEWYNF